VLTRTDKNFAHRGVLLTTGSYILYCLKSKKTIRKLVYGVLLINWTNHIMNLSSLLGIYIKMPCKFGSFIKKGLSTIYLSLLAVKPGKKLNVSVKLSKVDKLGKSHSQIARYSIN